MHQGAAVNSVLCQKDGAVSMNLRLITPPTGAAVSVDELKDHLVNSSDEQIADIALKLGAAETWMRNELDRPLITSTWELALGRWPCSYIDLPANTQSITHIKYTLALTAEQTLASTVYKLSRAYDPASGDSDAGPARLHLAYGQSWPTGTLDVGEPIVIRLVAGWKDATSVPVPIKQAVLMLASHWCRNKDAVVLGNTAAVVSAEVALGVRNLIAPYEVRRW